MASVRDIITNKIIEKLEKGVIPWHKPWNSTFDKPRNLITRIPYRGLNMFLLACTAYKSPYWLTRKQAADLGGAIRYNEMRKYEIVTFWARTEKKTGEYDAEGNEIIQKGMILRYYKVWNLEQCDLGRIPKPVLAEIEAEKEKTKTHKADAEAEKVLRRYLTDEEIDINFGGDRASYNPVHDCINMPKPEDFETPTEFYHTELHECVHSTGHISRLNREGIANFDRFGSEQYSKEELIAELGASMLCAEIGLGYETTLDNAAAYIQGWLKKLRNDSNFVINAASQAKKAVNYIIPVEQA
jgi:antirestriction protein ArdC